MIQSELRIIFEGDLKPLGIKEQTSFLQTKANAFKKKLNTYQTRNILPHGLGRPSSLKVPKPPTPPKFTMKPAEAKKVRLKVTTAIKGCSEIGPMIRDASRTKTLMDNFTQGRREGESR